jgi:hypothetical protein
MVEGSFITGVPTPESPVSFLQAVLSRDKINKGKMSFFMLGR